jgi:hypothetical protein
MCNAVKSWFQMTIKDFDDKWIIGAMFCDIVTGFKIVLLRNLNSRTQH